MINRRNIRLIIFLISGALSGLIAIQIYWIGNALELEKQRFENTVNTALQSVSEMVEKQEVAQNVRKRFDASRQGKKFFLGIDSLIRKSINRKDTTTSGLVYWNQISPGELQTEFRQITQDGNIEIIEENKTDSLGEVQYRKIRKAKQSNGNIMLSDQSSELNVPGKASDPRLERLMKKSGMVSDIFKELYNLNVNTGIDDRVNPELIDSFLREQLDLAGINTTYEFGLYDFTNNKMFVDHPTDNTQELMKTKFRVRLFPNDIFYHPDYLMVYFPRQNQYVFKNLWVMFASSGFFILLITATFYYTINTIIRQKKVASIKNDFINNMTHELKTPISTISLACEALSDADIVQTPKLTANYVRMIGEENKRLATLVENVLQTAVLDKSEFTLQLVQVNMHDIIQKTVKSLGMHLERNKVKLKLVLNAETAVIAGDQIHLTNGIFNLLDNAIKYRQDFPEITVETSNKEGFFVLTISDNGIGIAGDQQSKVFEKLYRVPTGNIHNVKGFGLGLSYVKAIVAKHKGTIKLESEVRIGSTFIIKLPFTQ